MAVENGLKSLERSPLKQNPRYEEYLQELGDYRLDGEAKIRALVNENQELKLNKQIDKKTKKELLEQNKKEIVVAKEVKKKNKKNVDNIVSKSITRYNHEWSSYYSVVCREAKEKIKEAKQVYANGLVEAKAENERKVATIDASLPKGDLKAEELKEAKKAQKVELRAQKISYRSKKLELKNNKQESIAKVKDDKFAAFMEKYGYDGQVRFDKHTPLESLDFKWKHYKYSFKLGDYLLRNAIYYVLLVFFIVCICIEPGLLSMNHLIGILGQSSTKIFYSLGVAGLILLGGTDLSIGRLTGASVTLVCMIMSQRDYTASAANGMNLDFTSWQFLPSLIIALLVSIIVCVLFTSIAGFFTAKFKMHPFITTLATQLVSYGIMMVLFASVPAFNMNGTWSRSIQGYNSVNLIYYAIIAIVIVWFIWNKTKFGKYMYAVGGNAEAASVSGINVFAVTIGIFIMAGVLYGLGGFFEAIRTTVGNPNTGFGTELDAIAACVVGGISFSGGIGKVSGAVVGTLIFTALTYCLTVCRIDVNMQYIFKGIIIMAAVCLDSLKYLKKK